MQLSPGASQSFINGARLSGSRDARASLGRFNAGRQATLQPSSEHFQIAQQSIPSNPHINDPRVMSQQAWASSHHFNKSAGEFMAQSIIEPIKSVTQILNETGNQEGLPNNLVAKGLGLGTNKFIQLLQQSGKLSGASNTPSRAQRLVESSVSGRVTPMDFINAASVVPDIGPAGRGIGKGAGLLADVAQAAARSRGYEFYRPVAELEKATGLRHVYSGVNIDIGLRRLRANEVPLDVALSIADRKGTNTLLSEAAKKSSNMSKKQVEILRAALHGEHTPDTVQLPQSILHLARREMQTHTTGRGAFGAPQYGLEKASQIMFGDKGTPDLVREFLPYLSRAITKAKAPSYAGIWDTPQSQLPFLQRTISGGVERATKYAQIPYPDIIGPHVPSGTAPTLENLAKFIGRQGIFTDVPRATVKDFMAGVTAAERDLPGSSLFGYNAGFAGGKSIPITFAGEHVIPTSFTGGKVTGTLLRNLTEGASPSEAFDLAQSTIAAGTEALSPRYMPRVTQALNAGIKKSGSLEAAIKATEEHGHPALTSQISEGSRTRRLFDLKQQAINAIDPTFAPPSAIDYFASDIKPSVKFGEKTYGAAEKAVDLLKSDNKEAQRKLAELLIELSRMR